MDSLASSDSSEVELPPSMDADDGGDEFLLLLLVVDDDELAVVVLLELLLVNRLRSIVEMYPLCAGSNL